jgi:plasmid stabilization system protein ParE
MVVSFACQAKADIQEIKKYIFFNSPLQAKRVTKKSLLNTKNIEIP